jgi:hypothetical protein
VGRLAIFRFASDLEEERKEGFLLLPLKSIETKKIVGSLYN